MPRYYTFTDAFYRENLVELNKRIHNNKHPLIIFVNKGVEIGTDALTLEIIADTCGSELARAAAFIVRFFTSLFPLY